MCQSRATGERWKGSEGQMTQALILGISLWSDPLSWVFIRAFRNCRGPPPPRSIRAGRLPCRGRGICGGALPSAPACQEGEAWGADPGPWFHPPPPAVTREHSPPAWLVLARLLDTLQGLFHENSSGNLGAGRPGCLSNCILGVTRSCH